MKYRRQDWVNDMSILKKFLCLALVLFPSPVLAQASGLSSSSQPQSYDNRMYQRPATVRQVTGRSFLPGNYSATTTMMTRSWQRAYVPVSSIEIAIPNWYVDTTTGGEIGFGGVLTATASVEYPKGTFTRITFNNGAASGTTANFTTLWSDLTPLGFTIPANAYFRIAIYMANPVGLANMNYAYASDRGRGDEFAYNGADHTMDATVQGSGTTSAYYPAAVMAQSDRTVWVSLGDSLTAGINETVTDPSGGRGFVGRALAKLGPYLNYGVPGDYAQWFVSSHARRIELIQAAGATAAFDLYGSNDIYNGRTSAQLVADRASIRGYLPNINVYDGTVTPRTSSTDGWKTAANQTISNSTNNTQRTTFNNAVRAGLTGSPGFVDIADAVETSTTDEFGPVQDGGVLIPRLLRKADGSSPDGVHLGTEGYRSLETLVNGLLAISN
jgi:lysophospholipase L1-like esterase